MEREKQKQKLYILKMFLFPDWYVKEVPQKRGKNGIVLTDVSILVGLKAVTIPARRLSFHRGGLEHPKSSSAGSPVGAGLSGSAPAARSALILGG